MVLFTLIPKIEYLGKELYECRSECSRLFKGEFPVLSREALATQEDVKNLGEWVKEDDRSCLPFFLAQRKAILSLVFLTMWPGFPTWRAMVALSHLFEKQME